MTKKDLTIAILVTFMWGINFSFIKLGLTSLDPFMLAVLRFFLCAIPLVFFIKKPDVRFIYVIAYGLFFGVGLWGILYLGMYELKDNLATPFKVVINECLDLAEAIAAEGAFKLINTSLDQAAIELRSFEKNAN